jgi:hypothetical protein
VEKHIAKAMFECMRYLQASGYARGRASGSDSRRMGTAP